MKTSDVEALAVAYWKKLPALSRLGLEWMYVPDERREEVRVLMRFIRDAVRAQDAARSGTLSAEKLADHIGHVRFHGFNVAADELETHSAAQGRANAALEAERDRLLAQGQADGRAIHDALVWAHGWHGKTLPTPSRDVTALIRERDEARAELAKAREAFADHIRNAATNMRRLQERALTAESALATLRQAVGPLVDEVSGTRQKSESSSLFLARDDEPGPEVLSAERLDALIAAYDATPAEHPDTIALATLRQAVSKLRKPAGHDGDEEGGQCDEDCDLCLWEALQAMVEDFSTPAEHPDTAMLRGIRERGKDDNRMLEAMDDAPISPDLLRDSDGDEGWAKVRAQARALRDYLLGDSGPSGGGEKPPTKPNVVPREPDCAPCEGTGSASKDKSMYGAADCKPCAGSGVAPDVAASEPTCRCGHPQTLHLDRRWRCLTCDCEAFASPAQPSASEPKPTPEEDWRTVEQALGHSGWCKCSPCGCGADAALAALARLKAEPRRAAEAMRERCAKKAEDAASSTDNEEAREVAEQLAKDLRALPL